MKRNLTLSILIVICIIVVAVIYLKIVSPAGKPARVAAADNRDFFPALHSLLSSAGNSIDVILYQGRFYFHYPGSASNLLISDLVDASERGVRVRVVLERADWNLENTEENRDVAHVLAGSGVEVYFDPPGTTSHTKLVIVDGRYAVVGSNNWSHYALDVNNEANVFMDSPAVARVFTRYFEEIAEKSDTEWIPPVEPIAMDEIGESRGRYALVRDVADSSRYDDDSQIGYVYIGEVKVVVRDRPLQEILAIDPVFFANAAGETVRVLGRIDRQANMQLDALDIESRDTPQAIAAAFRREREGIPKPDVDTEALTWIEGARVTPIPNRTYAPEVKKLIDSARSRIWIAMLDVRFYDSTPGTASKTKAPDEIPSLTNMVLGELVEAAVNGVEVRLVCDVGWQGEPPPDRLSFMKKLKAGGGQVYADSPELTTHAKLLIVDDDFVVVGSTNWSYHALEENNETSVVVESPELNDHYAQYIRTLIDQGHPF